jgi:tRNA-specific 2-thiouridylase
VKVVIAMSGGVDSSVAAALLKEDGHEVTGATMQLLPDGDAAAVAAAGVARKLGIPHRVTDFREIFNRQVVDDFCREYRRGRTPNPCVRCNRYIKFGALLEAAREIGAECIATGHYARVERDAGSGKYLLKKGADAAKDQSYFLHALTQEQLEHTLFPVGRLTKDRVREIAGEMELPATDRPESQDVCFIPGEGYSDFIRSRIPQAAGPGPILDEQGHTLGQHQGILGYTVGQRRGLGIAAAEPLYVTAIDAGRNAVVVGTREAIYGRELTATEVNWISGAPPSPATVIKASIRYRHPESEVFIKAMDDGCVFAKFSEPQMAITPGQSIVFYDGDTALGGGTIK